jgi:cyclopropane-fatty-acyl-phospholipid synthase
MVAILPIPGSLQAIAAAADVRFDGLRPWDLRVHDPNLFADLLRRGSLALGEGYVAGRWDCHQLDELISRLLQARANRPLSRRAWAAMAWERLLDRVSNPQSLMRSFRVGRQHYDIDHRVYRATLDPRLVYSCGYWHGVDSLEEAQLQKLERICRKLQLQPGQRLLDVGCGWGALAAHAAEHHGVQVTGITVSAAQYLWIRERYGHLPIQVELCDYRSLPGLLTQRYERIASVGMFEHVGPRNHAAFFRCMAELMDADGLLLLHTIGHGARVGGTDPWIDAYVFPGGRLPSAPELCVSSVPHLRLEDWENFGGDYVRTLLAWWQNFAGNWPHLESELGDSFYRFWRYYLLSCAGYFRSGQGQLWQLVMSRPDSPPVYRSVRPQLCV